ncbi:hypothetical protein [Microbacterium sp. cx-59]|uniref:hypothetical protein n=1 Tax=Microbacterium sp. cx-59 TaxID=2891207 RepID=UPI001E30C53F|nr:hypothetical protein [Microbacterium sp. cx-59]MCC4906819.1 hypothetical protein [Microbacterium sp. cx-59]
MVIMWLLAIPCLAGAAWIAMTKLKAAFARDDLRGLAATKEISFAAAALAGGIMFIALMSASVIFLVAFIAMCIAMITASVTRGLLQRAEHQGSPTVCANVRYRCAKTWRETKSTTKRFLTLAAPDGWREVRITVDTLENVVSVPTMLRALGVMYIVILVFVFVMSFVGLTGANGDIQAAAFSAAISYNMLAVSCLLTVTAVICFVIFLFLRWGDVLQRPLGVGSYVRRVATWIGYGGAVGAVMASLVPLAGLAVPSLVGPAAGTSALNTITPRSMLDFPAAGAVAGYAFGLIVATASLFPDSKNSWLRRVLCPGLFVVVLVALSHLLGGPRGLLRPVIDAAALRSGFNDASCTSAAPTDIDSGSLDATAWVITAIDRCGSGLLISTTAIGWIVVIAALLVGVSLFAVDIRVRAQSEDERSGDRGPASPAPSQRQTGST